MKKILCILSIIFTCSSFAEVVDPTGTDPGYKSLTFKLKILDEIVFPTYAAKDLKYSFGRNHWGKFDLPSLSNSPEKTIFTSKKYTIYETYNGEYSATYDGLTLKKGNLKKGAKIIEVYLKRIDINDMLVTKEDGTKYWAKGFANISIIDKNGNRRITVVSDMPTKRGVFVPIGYRYKVEVRAKTKDDFDEYSSILDFSTQSFL